jgi:hypothetical protein
MSDNDKSRVADETPSDACSTGRRRIRMTRGAAILPVALACIGALAVSGPSHARSAPDPSVPCRPDFCWQPPPPEEPFCWIEPWLCGSPAGR